MNSFHNCVTFKNTDFYKRKMLMCIVYTGQWIKYLKLFQRPEEESLRKAVWNMCHIY